MSGFMEFLADRSDLAFVALVVLEIAIIGFIALVAIRVAKRDAATRYAISLAGLALIAFSVPATWILQSRGWSTFAWERTIFVSQGPDVADAGVIAPNPLPA